MFRWKSASLDFGPRVFLQWFLRALVGPVVVLFCFIIPFFWLTRGLILMVVFFNVSSFVIIVLFVSLVFMPLIVILNGMVSLLMFRPVLTRPSLPFCAVILMLFLIVALIVLALLLMTPRGRVPPPLLIFFPLVVLWTSGVSYSRLFPASLGPGAMVFVPVESILLVALFLGCRWFLLGHRSLSLLRSFCRFAFVLGSSGFPVGFWPLEAKCFCAGGA